MPLTPQDVRNKEFSSQKGLRKGYDEDEVDAFLDEVEAELARLIGENSDLRSRVQTLQQQLAAAQSARPERTAAPPPVAVPQGEPVEQAALRTLQMAQRTADQTVAEARSEAEKITAEARSRAAALER